MSADKAEQAFCDGLTEELANWLAQIPTLRVVARTSAFAFRGQGEDVRKIGRELGTSHILEGSMRRSGDHMRINVQLVDAHNGYRLWSDNFDRPVQDAIKIQEDVSRAVAQTLQVRLTADSERQFAARRTAILRPISCTCWRGVTNSKRPWSPRIVRLIFIGKYSLRIQNLRLPMLGLRRPV